MAKGNFKDNTLRDLIIFALAILGIVVCFLCYSFIIEVPRYNVGDAEVDGGILQQDMRDDPDSYSRGYQAQVSSEPLAYSKGYSSLQTLVCSAEAESEALERGRRRRSRPRRISSIKVKEGCYAQIDYPKYD